MQPNRIAYTFLHGETETGSLTYAELACQVRVIAGFLQSRLPMGSKVLLAYQPGLDFVLAFLACLFAGVVAVPAYSPRRNQKTSRLRSIVANADIQFALTASQSASAFKQFCDEDPLLSKLLWLVTDAVEPEMAEQWKLPQLSAEMLAFLQYTSGSTGEPKGVMVSHANIMHNSQAIAQGFGHSDRSQGVIWLPPYHDMGLIGGVLQPLYAGFPVCLMSPIDFLQQPLRWLRAVSRYQATTSGGPNFAYELAVRRSSPEKRAGLDLSRWEVAFTGAEPIRAETIDRFVEVFEPYGFRREAFYPCYGMAESTLIITGGVKLTPPVLKHINADALEQGRLELSPPERHNTRTVVSCGQVLNGQRVIIVDPESLVPCAEGQVGEIWVAGDSIAQGYWNQSEETVANFQAYTATGANSSTPDAPVTDAPVTDALPKGPFMRTGDLGFLIEEELFVTGRIKDLIIIRGQNHYPQDVELTVEQSHPALRLDAGAAFSMELQRSEQLVIVQEVKRGHLRQLNVEEIFQNIRQAVTTHHALEVYAIALIKTGSILKTSSGKIRRRACKQAFMNDELNIVADWSRDTRRKATFQSLQSQIDTVFEKITKNTSSD
ncbi:MAG: fatty acyl-AMP ligase [Phormidesmis sp. RL_2_1]|nr:fatty acyl-AMP ligase [Phormidesmis sp. RL_2_1]